MLGDFGKAEPTDESSYPWRMRFWFGLTCLVACGLPFFACGSSDSGADPAPLPTPEVDASVSGEAAAAEGGCAKDVRADPKNCGTCGHDCLGGTCSAGACQPVRLAVDRSNLTWMAIDATHVYFCEDAVHRLGRVPKGGGAIELVGSACMGGISAALDDAFIYLNEPLIRVVNKVGLGAGTTILQANHEAYLADATNLYVFVPPGGGFQNGALARYTKPSGPTTPIGTPSGQGRFAQDATSLYVTQTDGIHQYAKDAASVPDAGSSLFVVAAEPADVAVDTTYVYYASPSTGSVKRVTKSDRSSDVVASGIDAPSALAVDASGIYFASADAGLIMSCPLSGCAGDPRILAERQAQPFGIAVDDVAVYWITRRGGTVMRVAK